MNTKIKDMMPSEATQRLRQIVVGHGVPELLQFPDLAFVFGLGRHDLGAHRHGAFVAPLVAEPGEDGGVVVGAVDGAVGELA